MPSAREAYFAGTLDTWTQKYLQEHHDEEKTSRTHMVYSLNYTWSKMEKEESESEGLAQLVNIGLIHWWSQPNEAHRYANGEGEKAA